MSKFRCRYKNITKTNNNIDECTIPIEERCDNFEDIWNFILDEVVSYWESTNYEKNSDTGAG